MFGSGVTKTMKDLPKPVKRGWGWSGLIENYQSSKILVFCNSSIYNENDL